MEVNSSELSLEFLFKTYYSRLVYFSFQLVKNKQQAEDLVQEAFINYWNQREELTKISSVKSYLYTAVKNASLNAVRHLKVTDKYSNYIALQDLGEETTINSIIRAEVLAELHAAIESLPEACRRISRLGFLEEKKNQEIAEELQISINTVKTQKKRGLQLLRLRLNPEVFTALAFLFYQN